MALKEFTTFNFLVFFKAYFVFFVFLFPINILITNFLSQNFVPWLIDVLQEMNLATCVIYMFKVHPFSQ
jgi:hypothetical protein